MEPIGYNVPIWSKVLSLGTYEEKELSSGIWKSVEDSTLVVLEEGQEWSNVKCWRDQQTSNTGGQSSNPFQSVGVTAEDSSVYFLLQESNRSDFEGLVGRCKCDPLNIPVIDQSTNERTHLVVQGKNVPVIWAGENGGHSIHGQSADGNCEHAIYLEVSMDDNTHLMTDTPTNTQFRTRCV